MLDSEHELLSFLQAKYGAVPKCLKLNEYVTFCPAGVKNKHNKSCYVKFQGHTALYGNHREDVAAQIWYSNSNKELIAKLGSYEYKQFMQRELARKQQEQIQLNKEKSVAITTRWEELSSHITYNIEYFARKGIELQPDFRQGEFKTPNMNKGIPCIYVPYYLLNGKIMALQQYSNSEYPHLAKIMYSGSQHEKAFYPFRGEHRMKDCDVLFITEGLATGYSVKEMARHMFNDIKSMTISCGPWHNVFKVIESIRETLPNIKLIGIADNDLHGKQCMINSNIPYMVFDCLEDNTGYDANDAYLANKTNACDEFFNKVLGLLN